MGIMADVNVTQAKIHGRWKIDGVQSTSGQVFLQHTVLVGSLIFGFIALPTVQGVSLVSSPLSVLCHALAVQICVTLSVYSFGLKCKNLTPAWWRLLRGLTALFIGALAFHMVAVLYGAPFTERLLQTHLWGWLMSVLTVAPTACTLGWDEDTWRRLYARAAPASAAEIALVIPAHGAVLGAWLGALPIPLDWDRPWQIWPISCVVGAVVGNALGLMVAVVCCWWDARKHNTDKKAA